MKTAGKAIRIINLNFFDLLSCSRIYATTCFRILAQALHGQYNSLEERWEMTILDGYFSQHLSCYLYFGITSINSQHSIFQGENHR